MPGGMGQHQGGEVQPFGMLGQHRLGGRQNLTLHDAAFAIEAVQVGGDDAGSDRVHRGEQLDGRGGIVQATGGVEAGAKLKADILGREVLRLKASQFQQHVEAQTMGGPQLLKAKLEQIARVVGLLGDISHDAKRNQVEQIGDVRIAAQTVVEGLDQLVGHPYARQGMEWMVRWQALGIDDGVGLR